MTKKISKKEFPEQKKGFANEIHFQERVKTLLLKMLEFDYIKIDTLGYYHPENTRYVKEELGNSIAARFADHLMPCNPDTTTKYKEELKNHPKKLEDWIKNQTPKTSQNIFNPEESYSVDRECPITSERFEWNFDGHTFRPLYRVLDMNEQDATWKTFEKERKALIKKQEKGGKPLSQDETNYLAILADMNTEFGWIKYYKDLHLAPAVPFSEKYADPKTGKLPQTIVEINVPTGVLVFADTLYEHVKDIPNKKEYTPEYNISTRLGRNNTSKFHATENVFYAHIGNNSPAIFQKKTDPSKLRVGNPVEDEPEKGQWTYKTAHRYWKNKGSICTGLWACMATDRSNLPKKIKPIHVTVKVPPGKYQMINHYEDQGHYTKIYLEINKISDIK